MRKLLLLISVLLFGNLFAQDHQKVLDLMNYVRTNPKDFAEQVATPYIEENELSSSRYARSLVKTLNRIRPMDSLTESESLNAIAQKFATKAGKLGWTDHRTYNSRFSEVEDEFGLTAENLDFGSTDELEIIMDLLIDEDIPSLGHRKNILDTELTHVGFGKAKHKSWGWIYVQNFGALYE